MKKKKNKAKKQDSVIRMAVSVGYGLYSVLMKEATSEKRTLANYVRFLLETHPGRPKHKG